MAPPVPDPKAELLQSAVENSHRMIQCISEGHSDLVMAIHQHSKAMMEDVTEKSVELMSNISKNVTAVLNDLAQAVDCLPVPVTSDAENSLDMTLQKLLSTRDSNLQYISENASALIQFVDASNNDWLESLQSLSIYERLKENTALVTSAIDIVRDSTVSSQEEPIAVNVKVVRDSTVSSQEELIAVNVKDEPQFEDDEVDQFDASDEEFVLATSKREMSNNFTVKTDASSDSNVNVKSRRLKLKSEKSKLKGKETKLKGGKTKLKGGKTKLKGGKTKLKGKDTKSKDKLVIQRQTVGRSTAKKQFVCPECGKVTNNSGHLKEHMFVHTKERNCVCPVCGKTYNSSGLRFHLKIHSSVRHTCTVCDKKFVHPFQLRTHMLYHTGDRPFKCDICGMAYFVNNDLKNHKKVKHGIGDDKVFPCDVCGRIFKLKCRLRAHRPVHEDKILVACEICGITISKKSLPVHMRLHTNEGLVTCEVCGKTFRRLDSYKIHMRIHTGDKRYKCTECDYASVDWSNLRKHTQKHHGKNVTVELLVQPDSSTADKSKTDGEMG